MPDTLYDIFCLYAFLMGAFIGSFLNVVIWRVPRGESIVSPPSHCPKCNARIRWWQNIPIASYIFLGGRCAKCREPISLRYMLVETIGGVLFLAAFIFYGFYAPIFWVWISLMIVGTFIDFDHQLLPDFVTIGGMVLGLVVSASFTLAGVKDAPFPPLLWSVAGLALGLGLLWLIRFLGTKAFGREAMGMGDVLLMGAVGALFGPIAVIFTLCIASVVGSIVGLSLIALSKIRLGKFVAIPFGPYLCLGCLVWMFFGEVLLGAYLRLIGLGAGA